jgi:hypothetical protein
MMKLLIKICIAAACVLSLVGCAGGALSLATATPAFTPTPSLAPSPTTPPTPTPLPGRLVLLAPDGSSGTIVDLIASSAQQAGLVLDKRAALQPGDVSADVKVVFFLSPPDNLKDLLSAAPQVQFGGLSQAALDAAPNLTVIQSSPDQAAFVAGFTAAVLSDDWRAAGLIPSEQSNLIDAFRNGAGYFCGDCAPGWPLGAQFPIFADVSAAGDGGAWAAAAQTLFDNGKAEVFYLSPEASKDEVYAALQGKAQVDKPVKVVGSGAPPAALKAQWAASVSVDPSDALKKALAEMLAGRSAGTLLAPIQLSDVNSDVLSKGRQELVQKVIADLQAGFIQIQSVP